MPDSDWHVEVHGSGSIVVTCPGSKGPWLYINGPLRVGEDEQTTQRVRYTMAMGIAKFLSGGPRPAWLDDMERTSELSIDGIDGSNIVPIGPTQVDETHPYGWSYREDPEAQNMQAKLIDRLWLKN